MTSKSVKPASFIMKLPKKSLPVQFYKSICGQDSVACEKQEKFF